jgi:hypothetical protein
LAHFRLRDQGKVGRWDLVKTTSHSIRHGGRRGRRESESRALSLARRVALVVVVVVAVAGKASIPCVLGWFG